MSKYPIIQTKNYDLTNHPLEKRGVLHAQIEIPPIQQSIELFSTHLDLTQWGRNRQVTTLSQIIQQTTHSQSKVVLGGDFNDWNLRIHNKLKSTNLNYIKPIPTFPCFLPLFSLDHIFYKNLHYITLI